MSLLAISLLVILLTVAYKAWTTGQRPTGSPPGPRTYPVVGNLAQLAGKRRELQMKKWADQFGPIYTVMMGPRVMIMLNTYTAVKDLFDKRGNLYSDRPQGYLFNIVSDDSRILMAPYGERWRTLRKLTHELLRPKAAEQWVQYQDLESKQLLHDLLTSPSRFREHMKRYAFSVGTQMVYGFRAPTSSHPKLVEIYASFEAFLAASGSAIAALLDIYPVLRSLPDFLLPARVFTKNLNDTMRSMHTSNWTDYKQKEESRKANPCMCTSVLQLQREQNISELSASYIAGSMMEAAGDTTASVLPVFVMAMALFPEAQSAAQRALDKVCGDRIPSLVDKDDLRCIQACVKETLRWLPTVALGFPHAVSADDEYMGYKIPKGAIVVCNTWAIHQNEQRYPSPKQFDPLRFIDDRTTASESAAAPDPAQRDHYSFGAGRRICPGMGVAERSLFLAIARILWAFSIEPPCDKDGTTLLSMDDITGGLLLEPIPFAAGFRPRSDARRKAIEKIWSEADLELSEDKQFVAKQDVYA